MGLHLRQQGHLLLGTDAPRPAGNRLTRQTAGALLLLQVVLDGAHRHAKEPRRFSLGPTTAHGVDNPLSEVD
jgi:hypothetical protein